MVLRAKDIEYRNVHRKLLGEQILAIMNRKGVSVAKLVERMEIREKQLERVLDGKYSISVDFLYHILDALDAHLEFVDND